LPGLIQRLPLLEEDQVNGQARLGRTNAALPVLRQTPDQIVRAAEIATTIVAMEDIHVSGHRVRQHIARTMPRVKGWQQNFVSYANANLAALGLVAADLVPITGGQTTWTAAYPAHVV